MEIQFVGIDPSLSRTAIVNGGDNYEGVKIFGSPPHGPDVAGRIMRFDKMAKEILTHLVALHAAKPIKLVAIESYSMGSAFQAAVLCEFGGILRLRLLQHFRVMEVSPSTLRKYVTGTGNCKKPELISKLCRTYGCQFNDEDEYFAYGLWLMARSALIEQAGNAAQRTLALGCLNPVKKERKPRKAKAVAE